MQSSRTHIRSFPLQFPYTRIHREHTDALATAPFLVSAMLTDNYSACAGRLARSCEEHGLPYIIYEVPTVHRSISPKGAADPSFTKPNFIHFLLETHRKPVLYVDVDCILAEVPVKIEEFIHEGYNFAIYNWLADEHTESYVPVKINRSVGNKTETFSDRFYRFSHSIDYFTTDQLICSGAVQFYNNTDAARALLRDWHGVILENPRSGDDMCLDYAFNNLPQSNVALKAAWLEKAYARIAWWIYERPVINLPDIPSYGENTWQPIQDRPHAKRFYPEHAQLRRVEYYFPKDCLIDTEKHILLKVQGGQLSPWRSFTQKLWL